VINPSDIIQNKHGRFYPYKGGYAPSQTTYEKSLANDGLIWWRGNVGNAEADRIMEEASDLGTAVHELTENVEKGGILYHEDPLVVQLADSYLKWVETAVEDVLGIEVPLVGELDGMAYGGTIDRIYRLKTGEIAIVDIKTSKQCSPSMGRQLAGLDNLLAQSPMLDGIVAKLTIVRLKIVRLKKDDPTKPPQVKDYTADYEKNIKVCRNNLENYYLTRANEIPEMNNE
jgi:hypothetical protein